ncbi:HIRAN domain-containing protein [Armatimonas sp.]|uniref:HIRAN domain-containing protein n=1 Tax=Armatimonas sp. TaxID=1872638 RepID=UPI0037533670
MTTVFLAWQNAETRRWFPIGQLQQQADVFEFRYLQGVSLAQELGGFTPLPEFQKLSATYRSETLFPLFANRVMPASRPDFAEYISWLRLEGQEKDPLAFLAQTNGLRQTDTLEVFSDIEPTSEGGWKTKFFIHGLRHMSPGASSRAESLEVGEQLRLFLDIQNPVDEKAVGLRTYAKSSGDMMPLGYCPRYLGEAVFASLLQDPKSVVTTVLAINPPPVPSQYRVLCEISFQPGSVFPFSGPEFRPFAGIA